MGDRNDHAGEVQQEVLQPVDSFDVQVVGRLVQHDDVGVAEERLGKQNLHLQTRIGVRHHIVVQLRADAQTL